jgi:hypothetical protein
MFRPLEAIIRFCPMSHRSVIYIYIYIICATAYQWWDLTSVTCWAGISDLIPSWGWGVICLGTASYGWVDASCSERGCRRCDCYTSTCFDFVQNFSETFLIIKRIQLDIIIKVHRSSCKVPVILVRVSWNLNVLDTFCKVVKYQISWKSVR